MDEFNSEENKIINSINLFMNIKEEKYQFKSNYLILLKTIIPISDLDFAKLNGKMKRRLNLIFNKNNIFKFNFDLNENKFFLLFIYNYIYENSKIPDFIDVFYKNNLISFHTIFLFFDFFLSLIDDKEINMELYVEYIISIITHVKKLIKITKMINIKEINNDIHYLLERIFCSNNMSNLQNIKFTKNLIKHPKILSLLKLCYNYYNNHIINDINKKYILHNLKQLFFKNLNNEHSNYLYSISKKFLKTNFNNNNQRKENKNYYSYINGLIEFFNQLIDEEKHYNSNDKFFLFDSSEEDEGVLMTSAINLNNESKFSGINLSFIFSFKNIKSKQSYINNNNKKVVILSVNNFKDKKSIFYIYINNNNLYLGLDFNDENQNKNLLMKNVEDNINYLCYLYFEENIFRFHKDEDEDPKMIKHNLKLKNIRKIYILLGGINTKINDNKFLKFNGLIGPVLVYNSKIFHTSNIFERIRVLKEKYYLLGDIINNKFLEKKEDSFHFVYNKYYGIFNNQNEITNIINSIEKELNYPILYINPEIIFNNMCFNKKNTFRDYQSYDFLNDIQSNAYTYEYPEIKNMKNIDNLILIQKPFLDFFINNKMFDFLLLNIEYIYNEILIFDSKDISEEKYIIL